MTEALRRSIKEGTWRLYSLLNGHSVADKGDVRAYIGLKTWWYERDIQENNVKERHARAFGLAIKDINTIFTPSQFRDEFNDIMEVWRQEGGPLSRTPSRTASIELPVKKIKNWKKNGYNFVSLFSGAFGLDLGFMAMGFNPLIALDIDPAAHDTIRKNLPNLPFITEDINTVSTKRILEEIGKDVGEIDLLTGGPPCQPFSTAGRRESLQDPRASPLTEYIRFIKEAQPKCFVMEEVTGLLSARILHVPINQRKGKVLSPEEIPGSAFKSVLAMLRSTGYHFTYNILNAADYGAPQIRRRVIIIGSQDARPEMPGPTHSGKEYHTLGGKLLPWSSFWEATCDLQGRKMECSPLTQISENYLKFVPPGGYWRHLPDGLIKEAMGGAYLSGGGKMGFFRRLSWDTPTPTVVTTPNQKGSMLCHPEELRPMSVEECKRVQGFPDDWEIPGSTNTKYKFIGNAVPVYLSHAIARPVAELLNH